MTPPEPTQTITIELPTSVIQYLSRVGQLTQQSVADLAEQSIRGNLPPSVEHAPAAIQADLLAMQEYPLDQLTKIAHSQVSPTDQAQHTALLAKLDRLTSSERTELSQLRLQADQLMLKKAYAWSLLRWRGQRIPSLNELPFE